jgi:hypothetical protein
MMLHCNMNPATLHWQLDDLVAELRHARRNGDLGRLALIAYCEVRRWARAAGQAELAEQASRMVLDSPHSTREAFLAGIDDLLDGLERVHDGPARAAAAPARRR